MCVITIFSTSSADLVLPEYTMRSISHCINDPFCFVRLYYLRKAIHAYKMCSLVRIDYVISPKQFRSHLFDFRRHVNGIDTTKELGQSHLRKIVSSLA